MIQVIKEGGITKAYIKEYVVDTVAEIAELPTNLTMGSSAICLEDKKTYYLSGQGRWVAIE